MYRCIYIYMYMYISRSGSLLGQVHRHTHIPHESITNTDKPPCINHFLGKTMFVSRFRLLLTGDSTKRLLQTNEVHAFRMCMYLYMIIYVSCIII